MMQSSIKMCAASSSRQPMQQHLPATTATCKTVLQAANQGRPGLNSKSKQPRTSLESNTGWSVATYSSCSQGLPRTVPQYQPQFSVPQYLPQFLVRNGCMHVFCMVIQRQESNRAPGGCKLPGTHKIVPHMFQLQGCTQPATKGYKLQQTKAYGQLPGQQQTAELRPTSHGNACSSSSSRLSSANGCSQPPRECSKACSTKVRFV